MVLELLLFPLLNSGTVYLFLSALVTIFKVLLNPNSKLIFLRKLIILSDFYFLLLLMHIFNC